MTRSTVLLPILLVAACSVGEYGMTMQGSDSSTNADRNLCVNKGTPGPAHNHAEAGINPAGPRSGMACLTAGCHGVGGTPPFAFAGTAYGQIGGTSILGGVTIRVFKAGTQVSLAKTVTDDAGNFYIDGTFNDFPYEVDITGCGSTPDIIPMVQPIQRQDANCASSGACHAIPGTRAIYLQ